MCVWPCARACAVTDTHVRVNPLSLDTRACASALNAANAGVCAAHVRGVLGPAGARVGAAGTVPGDRPPWLLLPSHPQSHWGAWETKGLCRGRSKQMLSLPFFS